MPKICLMCGASFPDATTFCPADGSALRAAVQGDDLIGELVAERYLITDLLSQGGMGEVYLASDVRLPQQFAIKVLKHRSRPIRR
jgi:serine/threonine-protein kinase